MINVKHIAKLANLPLTDEEEEKYSEQLSNILEYVDQLDSVDASGVEPTFNVSGQENIMAEDKIGECLDWKKGLPAGPLRRSFSEASRQGFFVTKGVFANE